MQVNHVPMASKVNETGCCPKFDSRGWDGQTFTFKDKPFVRFTVRSLFYIPLNMGKMIARTTAAVEQAGATDKKECLMLSHDLSPWQSEHYLAVTKEVKGLENIKLSGTYRARVFEGPFQDTPRWIKAMDSKDKVYLYYTTCPKCSKVYGKNYVVAFAQI